jgi:hypothetical protein
MALWTDADSTSCALRDKLDVMVDGRTLESMQSHL